MRYNNYYEKIGSEFRNITDEIPFEIPGSWAWVRLSDLITNIPSKSFQINAKEILDKGIYPVVSQSMNLIDGFSNEINKVLRLENPILLFGDHTRVLKLIDFDFIVGADGTKLLLPLLDNITAYLYYAIRYFIINMRTRGYSRHYQFIKNHILPLPPLEEQKRIVRRIEFLEPYVEEYDKAETELSILNETFPDQIKKSILQYAIQGKLVPQDPSDEPASVLLDKIKAEKQKLIKAGKIKKDKIESYIYKRDNRHYEKIDDKEVDITDEIPFEIPDSWAWVRFKNLVHYRMGKTPQRKDEQFWEPGTFPWVSIADLIPDGMLERTKEKISDYAVSQIFKGEFSPQGTLLMSFKLTVGKVSILNINAVHNEAIISIYPYLNTDNSIRDYLFKFMPLLSQEGRTKTAIKGKTLNSDSIDALLIPLPPVAEQKRIVTKMDKLLSLLPTHN